MGKTVSRAWKGWQGISHISTAFSLLQLLPGWAWIVSVVTGTVVGGLAVIGSQPLWAVALIGLGSLALTAVFLVGVDTLIRRWRQSAASPIGINSKVYAESAAFTGHVSPEVGIYRASFFILVTNRSSSRATLRRVTAKYHLMGQPLALKCRGGSDNYSTDLRHGETAYFELGEAYCANLVGTPVLSSDEFPALDIDLAMGDFANGHSRMVIGKEHSNPVRLCFPAGMELTDLAGWVIVSADDVNSAALAIKIDTRLLPNTAAAFQTFPLERH